MANSLLAALHGVDLALPDGTALFQDLHETLLAETVGLIGRNGSGKSVFGKLVSGALDPTRGRIERACAVYRVSQQAGPADASSLAQLAGVDATLAAARRLARGDGLPDDVGTVGDQWDIESRWVAMLDRAGLDESLAPAVLSGGQRMLLSLIGGFCSGAGLLVLDEPSNHLDRANRRFLENEIARWRQQGRGLLLITHDRALLAKVDRIIETHQGGLRRYGGGWATVECQREAELGAATARLMQAKTERRREQSALRAQAERAERKTARGERERHSGSQSKLLLDARRDRSDRSNGALAERQARRSQELAHGVTDAFAALGGTLDLPQFPDLESIAVPNGLASLVFDEVVPPWGSSAPLTWTGHGPVRIAIRGPNGCGKTTLLHMIAGRLAPARGRSARPLDCALIDQTLALLDHERPLLEQLMESAPHPESRLRQYLALAGIGSGRLAQPLRTLSGGEQMRGALLRAVLADPPARMLLLDEPTNHLDLQATQALESMLGGWKGALVIVSHDEAFLERLALTHSIDWAGDGWKVCAT